jgi:hypothetical protein
MGDGEISKLIAWASNSRYSHSALVLDSSTLIEATGAGVKTKPLAPRLTDSQEFSLIDAWRFGGVDAQLSAARLAALQDSARSFLGAPYPLNQLFELGIVCALRDKLAWPEPLKWLLRIALDQAVHSDPGQMVCSEFIYRSFADAKTEPPGALRPIIDVVAAAQLPFPDIDWFALYREYEEARQASPHTLPAAPLRASAAPSPAAPATVDPEHAALARQIRQMRRSARTPMAGIAEIVAPWPNPETVTPEDFATSPSFALAAQILPHR